MEVLQHVLFEWRSRQLRILIFTHVLDVEENSTSIELRIIKVCAREISEDLCLTVHSSARLGKKKALAEFEVLLFEGKGEDVLELRKEDMSQELPASTHDHKALGDNSMKSFRLPCELLGRLETQRRICGERALLVVVLVAEVGLEEAVWVEEEETILAVTPRSLVSVGLQAVGQ